MRSLFSKIQNFSKGVLERQGDIAFLTEIWQKQESKKHNFKIEKMFETSGIKYISTPRSGAKRGGGAAIAIKTGNFILSKLNILIPKSLEVVWGLLKPKVFTGNIRKIIVCCFYSPPHSRKNGALIDHLTVTLQLLLKTHRAAGVILSGDRNSIEVSTLLSIDPALQQIVKVPTRGLRTLDVIVTNLGRYYHDAVIVPPIKPDNPGFGVPSDHMGVFAKPNTSSTQVAQRMKVKKIIRPIPESLLDSFGQKIMSETFNFGANMGVAQMVQHFQDKMQVLVENTFPEKHIVIKPDDRPYFTENLRHLKRQRQREYHKHGRSTKYLKLKDIFEEKLKNEKMKYIKKVQIEVCEGKRGSTYPALKKLGLRPGHDVQSQFLLPSHADRNLSAAQSAEIIADHFSNISQEYAPLNTANLPPNIKQYLVDQDQDLVPVLSTHDVHRRICRARKPNSLVPGDIPVKLVKTFPDILAYPVTDIFNRITQTAVYPPQWKIEQQIPIPKISPPSTEDELRNISKTPFLSKVYESFLGDWLLEIVAPHLDPGQCGMKGSFITHYMIKLFHFIFSTLDHRQPHAVLAAFIDMSKAFNRVDHTLLIQDLFDMHTPCWLLKILISYLSNRSMYLSYNGAKSTQKQLQGGGPQGAYLGGILFMLKYNGAFLRPPIPRNIGGPISRSKAVKVKFVDDGTVAVGLNLKDCLELDKIDRQKPLNYRERTNHVVPAQNNLLQAYLKDTQRYAVENKMIINKKKTQVMIFNKSRKYDFPPERKFDDGEHLEVIHETKLLGVMISDDIFWHRNTTFICKQAREKLWILRRMINLNLGAVKLYDVYCKEIRCLLEYAVPVWHPALTKKDTAMIESIQKIAFKIILSYRYINYEIACLTFHTTTLELRREKLCRNFANKNFKCENSFFTIKQKLVNTRRKQNRVE